MTGRFIFLDFDGCVNNYAETPGSYATHLPDEYGPSFSNIERLRNLAEECDAKIIISSNWRKFKLSGPNSVWHHANGDYLNPLGKLYEQLGDLVYGSLPPYRHMLKSEVLILWMEENDFDGQFVIFDDDPREAFATTHDYSLCDHYIHVKSEFGITDADCKRAKKILMKGL